MASAPRLEGKVAIVTGAGSRAEGIGNGRAAAVLFAVMKAIVGALAAFGDDITAFIEGLSAELGIN